MNIIRPFIVIIIILTIISCANDDSRQETFNTVWQTVNETFPDSAFGGKNWESIKSTYEQNLSGITSDSEICSLINKMLFELNVSHTFIGPISEIQQKASPYMFQPGSPGFDIRILDDEVIVTRIDNPQVEKSGLQPGCELVSIDGYPVEEIISEASLMPPYNNRYKHFLQTEEVLRHLYGQPESTFQIEYEDVNGSVQSQKIIRIARENSIVLAPEIPPIYLECEWRKLENEVGYLRFNAFQPENPTEVLAALDSLSDSKGLILDLRGNNGGSTSAQQAIGGRFFADTVAAAIIGTRHNDDTLYYYGSHDTLTGPVVILVDEVSISAAEMFPAAMQSLNRATIIGAQTPGAVMGGDLIFLNDSLCLVHPIFSVKTVQGIMLEGQGVIPDIEIALNKELLSKGIDTQLEAAKDYLKDKM
ncbi:MAG: hypothetical protein KAR42_09120 [candidate division Zixibacteria bacterium]|nr:hypothetical protein [candidate division Zixibacteria bacterium]